MCFGSPNMHCKPCNPTKVISHTFKSRQQDIKDALLVGWFALMPVPRECVPTNHKVAKGGMKYDAILNAGVQKCLSAKELLS